MQKEQYDKLKGFLGLAYRGSFLLHSSLLNKKIYKNKVNLIIVNRKIDEYLQDALTKSEYNQSLYYLDIEQILNELFGLVNINAIGITNVHIAKEIKKIIKEVELNGKE